MIHRIESIRNYLEKQGYEIGSRETMLGISIVEGKIETGRGALEVAWGTNGTARVIKPNGTVKWLYEKSFPQIARALEQTIWCNR